MGLLRHFLRPSRGAGLAVALLFASAQAVAAVAVEGLRLWRGEGKTRLVFDLDAPVRHKLSTMSGPDRLVIDLEQGRLAAPLHTVEFAGTQIRSIRSGPYGPGQLRIVLDLHDEVSANSFTLAPSSGQGHRLVIDLVGGVPAQSAVRPVLAQQTQASVPPQTVPANTVVSRQAAPTAAVSSSQQPAAVASPPSPPAARRLATIPRVPPPDRAPPRHAAAGAPGHRFP